MVLEMEILIILVIASASTIAFSFETFGIWGRYLGSRDGGASQGYSLHVRAASIGRFGNFVIPPALGFLVDVYKSPVLLCVAASSACFCSAFFGALISPQISKKVLVVPSSRSRCKSRFGDLLTARAARAKVNTVVRSGVLAYAIIIMGVYAANILASAIPAHRALLVQTATLITGVGTLIHVFVADPSICALCDSGPVMAKFASRAYVRARLLAALIAGLGFLVLGVAILQ